jgi:hypothetical protein
MKCAVHSDLDAVAYCRNCGKPLCSTCARPVRDVIYCEDCLAATLGLPTAPPPAGSMPVTTLETPGFAPSVPEAYSPMAQSTPIVQGVPAGMVAPPRANHAAVAFMLGLVPGLGAVYNGEYNKALIHIVVFASMIVGLNSDIGGGADAALWLLLWGFVFYMAFDAMRTAKAHGYGQAQIDPLENWSRERPIGPIILIGLGALFLLNNFSWFSFYRVQRLWPLVLIGAGVLMFRNRLGRDF